jgi:transaldolase
MKIFIDTANIEAIKKFSEMGIIDGVTTNPTLIAREGIKFNELINEIVHIVNGPVSVEAVSLDVEGMVREARQLSKIASNVVVKIPMIAEGLKAVKTLSREGVKINMTLVFSANQALLAAKAGATYVSPFIGRLDDRGHVGMDVVREILEIFKNYNFKTEVIVASIRHPIHVIEAAKAGAHVATIPPNVLEEMLKHPLTDVGLQRFLEDWKKVKELGGEF